MGQRRLAHAFFSRPVSEASQEELVFMWKEVPPDYVNSGYTRTLKFTSILSQPTVTAFGLNNG